MLQTLLPDRVSARNSGIIITVEPAGRDLFSARLNGRLLCKNRTPFCTAARSLLEQGYAPGSILTLRHIGSQTDCLRATIGAAARLTIEEGEWAPRFRPWKAGFNALAGERVVRWASTAAATRVYTFRRPRIEAERDGQAWLVVAPNGRGWLHGDRRRALAEFDELVRIDRRGWA
jgi:hypothetical protein